MKNYRTNWSNLWEIKEEEEYIRMKYWEQCMASPIQDEINKHRNASFAYRIMRSSVRLAYDGVKLQKLADEISDYMGYGYWIAVLPFEELSLVAENGAIVIGEGVAKDKYFAVVDESSRTVGVYIPRTLTVRQRVIDGKIQQALKALDQYFMEKGATPNPEVRKLLEEYMWGIKYPYYIPDVQVVAVRKDLRDDCLTKMIPGVGRYIQLTYRIFPDCVKVYYHMV